MSAVPHPLSRHAEHVRPLKKKWHHVQKQIERLISGLPLAESHEVSIYVRADATNLPVKRAENEPTCNGNGE